MGCMRDVWDQHVANMLEAQGEVVDKVLPVVRGRDISLHVLW